MGNFHIAAGVYVKMSFNFFYHKAKCTCIRILLIIFFCDYSIHVDIWKFSNVLELGDEFDHSEQGG